MRHKDKGRRELRSEKLEDIEVPALDLLSRFASELSFL